MYQNAVIYLRVSSAEQVENFSLSTQEKACRQYCANNNLTVVEAFREEGESAKSMDRTQLRRMLELCANKKAGIRWVVVHSVSRFSRNSADFHGMQALLSKQGISLRSATEAVSC